jgi:hypothetical protein
MSKLLDGYIAFDIVVGGVANPERLRARMLSYPKNWAYVSYQRIEGRTIMHGEAELSDVEAMFGGEITRDGSELKLRGFDKDRYGTGVIMDIALKSRFATVL